MSAPETWFKIEIEAGIQSMCRNGLHFRPGTAEDQEVRAAAWVETLWPGKRWDTHRDIPRIRKTFSFLCKHHGEFPTPKDFERVIRDISMGMLIEHKKDPIKEMTRDELRKMRRKIAARMRTIKERLKYGNSVIEITADRPKNTEET